MKRFIVCVAAILAFSACKSSWSSAEKDAFVKSCTNAAVANGSMTETKAKDYCSCMMPKVEAKYPDPNDAGKMTAEDMATFVKECQK